MASKKNIIAMVYDFDGTLSPQPMQEYTVFPELKIQPGKFWKEVKAENRAINGEEIITYMMLMLKKATEQQLKISKIELGRMAKKIEYFPGVETFFDRINKFAEEISDNKVRVKHYIISSGLKEILGKVKIKKHFENIFASEFHYDAYGRPLYPKLVVTDTVKTQFLFRINKGREKIHENINEFMKEEDRSVPFSSIIYIGDGLTDVPCMTVTTKNGGTSIAVFKPRKIKDISKCKELFKHERVDYIAEADYRNGSELDTFIKETLHLKIQDIKILDIQMEMIKRRKIG
jgi:phosphoserine phosphatase